MTPSTGQNRFRRFAMLQLVAGYKCRQMLNASFA